MLAAAGVAAGPAAPEEDSTPDSASATEAVRISPVATPPGAITEAIDILPGSPRPDGAHPVPTRLRLAPGGGVLFPVGSWADGFDPGISLGVGVARPVRPDLEVGAWVSRAEIRMEGRASITWTAFEARAAWYPPVSLAPASLYLTGRAGLLRSVLEAGQGREDEWNLLAGGGAGILLPLSARYGFRVEGLWRRVFAEGQGVSLNGGLLIEM